MTVADRIKNKRIEMGLSQSDLAKRAGYCDKTAISKIENAGNNITMKQIRRIALALNTTDVYLMGWDEKAQALSKASEEISNKMQPVIEKMKLLSYQVDMENEKFKQAVEIFEQIEVLPENKKAELIKYLRFLQSDL